MLTAVINLNPSFELIPETCSIPDLGSPDPGSFATIVVILGSWFSVLGSV